MTTATEKQAPSADWVIGKGICLGVSWYLLLKIRKRYGSRAFWLAYFASSFSVTTAQWAEIQKKLTEVRKLREDQRKKNEAISQLADRMKASNVGRMGGAGGAVTDQNLQDLIDLIRRGIPKEGSL